ncbi:MAG: hypothetical protein ABIG39_03825 [Candidatus Micrarchaeota archaeon]
MKVVRNLQILTLLILLTSIPYSQTPNLEQNNLIIIQLAALLVGLLAATLAWRWYFSTISKPPILLWFGVGMVSDLLIKWLNISLSPSTNSAPELLTTAVQVVSGAFFLMGLWAFLCTRWIKASPNLSKQFLLILSIVILFLLGYGVLNGQPGNEMTIAYTIYVLTAFWMLLYIFITLMSLYAYIKTDEMMLAWFSAGFSMMVFASWYRLLFVTVDLLPEQKAISSMLPLITSICYIVGVFAFQKAGKY